MPKKYRVPQKGEVSTYQGWGGEGGRIEDILRSVKLNGGEWRIVVWVLFGYIYVL